MYYYTKDGEKAIKIPSKKIAKLLKKRNECIENEIYLTKILNDIDLELKGLQGKTNPRTSQLSYERNQIKNDLLHLGSKKIRITNQIKDRLKRKDFSERDYIKFLDIGKVTEFVSPTNIDMTMEEHSDLNPPSSTETSKQDETISNSVDITSEEAYQSILNNLGLGNGKDNSNTDLGFDSIDIPLVGSDEEKFNSKMSQINTDATKDTQKTAKVLVNRVLKPSTSVGRATKTKKFAENQEPRTINDLIKNAKKVQNDLKKMQANISDTNKNIQNLQDKYNTQQAIIEQKAMKLYQAYKQQLSVYEEEYDRVQTAQNKMEAQLAQAKREEEDLNQMLSEMSYDNKGNKKL